MGNEHRSVPKAIFEIRERVDGSSQFLFQDLITAGPSHDKFNIE